MLTFKVPSQQASEHKAATHGACEVGEAQTLKRFSYRLTIFGWKASGRGCCVRGDSMQALWAVVACFPGPGQSIWRA